ncbi:hypothetical protein MSAN_01650500 [Mycena sanguinolenta]|uniref:Uncharacterized protein n=1 Tax=Mycena sanguinolenta TaxID=230812 RepID=A0A8H6Y2R9_9AGAR|nr:hypothetical protein MSAN_01650500 [Mycena sanguinolenta]
MDDSLHTPSQALSAPRLHSAAPPLTRPPHREHLGVPGTSTVLLASRPNAALAHIDPAPSRPAPFNRALPHDSRLYTGLRRVNDVVLAVCASTDERAAHRARSLPTRMQSIAQMHAHSSPFQIPHLARCRRGQIRVSGMISREKSLSTHQNTPNVELTRLDGRTQRRKRRVIGEDTGPRYCSVQKEDKVGATAGTSTRTTHEKVRNQTRGRASTSTFLREYVGPT